MAQKRMKLSQFAKEQNIAYTTAYRHWCRGNIEGIQLPGGTILVEGWREAQGNENKEVQLAIVYSRVSGLNKKEELKKRTAELSNFALEQGYEIVDIIEEVGSGFSDKRTKLLNILHRTDWDVLIAEEEGQLFKFSFPYIEVLLSQSGKEIHLMSDFSEREAANKSLAMNGEQQLITFFRTVQEIIRPLVGYQGAKKNIGNHIDNLMG